MTINKAPVVVIHRVGSVEEALRFERLGADYIGVALRPEHGAGLFDDDRALSERAAEEVDRALGRARLVVSLCDPVDQDPASVVELARRLSAACVEAPVFDLPTAEVRTALTDADIGLVVSRISASHDDDPGWLLTPVEELADPNIAFVEIELLADQDGAWEFMTRESPKFPDELQIADIDALAREAPLLVSLDVSPANVEPILQSLPHVRGLSLTLGTLAAGRYDVHACDADRAAAIVAAVRRQASG